MFGNDVDIFKIVSSVSQEKLKQNRPQICKRLNPDPDLFCRLVACSVLTERQASSCQAKQGRYNQSVALLNLLQRRPFKDFIKFCEILQDIGQAHIVTDYLLFHCDKPQSSWKFPVSQEVRENRAPINPDWRDIVRINMTWLAEDLNPDEGLMNELVALGVIQEHLSDTFEEVLGRTNRSVKILMHLSQKCGDDHFLSFHEALHRTKQSYIIDKYFSSASPFVSPSRDDTDGTRSIEPDELRSLTGDWKKTLIRQHSILVGRLSVSEDLVRDLEAENILNSRQRDVLLEKEESFERTDSLLDHMKRRDDVDFVKFCRILETSGQEHIVNDYLKHVYTDDSCEKNVVKESQKQIHTEECGRRNAVKDALKQVSIESIDEEYIEEYLHSNAMPCYNQVTKSLGSLDVDLARMNIAHEQSEEVSSSQSTSLCLSSLPQLCSYVNSEQESKGMPLVPATEMQNDLASKNARSDKTTGPIEIEQVRVRPCTREFYDQNKDKSYQMTAKCRGRCVVVNIHRTEGQTDRRGSEVDERLLTQLFSQFHFEVKVYNDLTAQEIRDLMDSLSSDPTLQQDQCLVVFFLSHGELEVIKGGGNESPTKVSAVVDCLYGSDGQIVYNDEDILNKFTEQRCPALKGRPKLFFFQACRGKNYDQCDSGRCSVDYEAPVISSFADFLILYPTHSYFRSFRNTAYGSWYINAIVRVFMKHAHNTGVCAMMNMVNGLVSTWKSHTEDVQFNGKTQVAEFSSKLRKADVYFFPGIVDVE